MIGRVDHRSRRNLGLVLLQGSLGGAWGLRARTRGLQLTLLDRHRESPIACRRLLSETKMTVSVTRYEVGQEHITDMETVQETG